jgi:hypothetical protein
MYAVNGYTKKVSERKQVNYACELVGVQSTEQRRSEKRRLLLQIGLRKTYDFSRNFITLTA